MNATAQDCNPDQNITDPGIYPEYLDTGMVGNSYSHTLQILAVDDTTVVYAGQTITATVDSVVLNDIQGLPATFSYGCNPDRCVYTSASVGCAILEGMPTNAEKGVHPLSIIVTSYARWNSLKLPVKDTIDNFVLVIQDSATASILDKSEINYSISPNPIQTGNIKVTLSVPGVKYLLINPKGEIVKEESMLKMLHFEVGTEDLAEGIYSLIIETESGSISEKVVLLP